MKPRALRLGWELDDLLVAVEGIHLLIDRIHGESDHDVGQIASGAGALLALVAYRLRDLRRAVQGDIDPASLGSANLSAPQAGEQDMFLASQPKPRTRRR